MTSEHTHIPTDVDLRRRAEEVEQRSAAQSPEDIDSLSAEEIRRRFHELRVHQIELEMQNVQLRQAQVALEVLQARYFDLYDMAPVGYCTISRQGLLTATNLKASELLGLARGELVGQRFSRYIHAEDNDVYYLLRKQLFESCEPQSCDLRMVQSGGTVFWAHLSSTLAQDESGALVSRILLSDITERKQAEEALRESELNFKTLADSGQALIWTAGTDKRCNYFNRVWLEFTGHTVEQENGDGWLEGVHIDDRQHCHEIYVGAFDRREKFSMVYRLRRSDGEYRWLLDEGCPRYDSKGTFIGYIGHCLDITKLKRADEETKTLHAQLLQAHKMEAIGTLAGGIAHDFNNILGAILGYTEIVSDIFPPDSIATEYLDKIMKASYRAANLVKQILAFSRQANIERVPLKPGSIVEEAIKLLRPSLPSTITITLSIAAGNKLIFADPTQVHQILMNLGTNASHAMEQTGGTLGIILEDRELSQENLQYQPEVQPGKFVLFSVSDTGTGIEPEILDKIFDPYFTTKEVGKGTGMGLSIVHGIVTSCGGFVTCESEIGKGTVFNIFFPAIEERAVSEIKPMNVTPSGTERILFIDDEVMLAELGKTMLERLGYDVTIRTSSLEALAIFQKQPERFDAVITDQTMSDLTGMDLARQILQIRPDIPIILCTGYSTLISEEQAKVQGVKGFAMKPLSKNEIATLLRKVLDE